MFDVASVRVYPSWGAREDHGVSSPFLPIPLLATPMPKRTPRK